MTNSPVRDSATTPSSSARATTASRCRGATWRAPVGKSALVLERRARSLGGAAVTEEIFPGFRFSVFTYVVSLLRPEIIRELDLPRHGLKMLPLDGTFTPMHNGDYLWRVDRPRARRAAKSRATRRWMPRPPTNTAVAMVEMGRFAQADPRAWCRRIRSSMSIARPAGAARRSASSFRDDALIATSVNQVQLLTMSAVDFLDQWFESDVLKATMSASRHHRHVPRRALARHRLRAAAPLHGRDRRRLPLVGPVAKTAPVAVSQAIASAAVDGSARKSAPSAPVATCSSSGGRATGVVLENGDELHAERRACRASIRA